MAREALQAIVHGVTGVSQTWLSLTTKPMSSFFKVWNNYGQINTSPPLSMISPSMVSVTYGQLQSELLHGKFQK